MVLVQRPTTGHMLKKNNYPDPSQLRKKRVDRSVDVVNDAYDGPNIYTIRT